MRLSFRNTEICDLFDMEDRKVMEVRSFSDEGFRGRCFRGGGWVGFGT
jgi:hypothetical protein